MTYVSIISYQLDIVQNMLNVMKDIFIEAFKLLNGFKLSFIDINKLILLAGSVTCAHHAHGHSGNVMGTLIQTKSHEHNYMLTTCHLGTTDVQVKVKVINGSLTPESPRVTEPWRPSGWKTAYLRMEALHTWVENPHGTTWMGGGLILRSSDSFSVLFCFD